MIFLVAISTITIRRISLFFQFDHQPNSFLPFRAYLLSCLSFCTFETYYMFTRRLALDL